MPPKGLAIELKICKNTSDHDVIMVHQGNECPLCVCTGKSDEPKYMVPLEDIKSIIKALQHRIRDDHDLPAVIPMSQWTHEMQDGARDYAFKVYGLSELLDILDRLNPKEQQNENSFTH